ncbi:MAG: tetratricopeptide repeat protein, partial [Alphaproteobacteria bacterium]
LAAGPMATKRVQARHAITTAALEGLNEQDPERARQLLEAGAFDGHLSPEAKNHLVNNNFVELRRREALAEQQRRLAEADDVYRRILEVVPDHAAVLHLRGVLRFQDGKYEEALVLIGQAIALEEDQAAYHANLGEALKSLGRTDEAEASLRHAIALDPGLAAAHHNLGLLLAATDRFEDAVASHRRAVDLNPSYAKALYGLGLALGKLGRVAEAEASLTSAATVQPDHADAWNTIGNLQAAQGRLGEAIASYGQALKINPDMVQAHNNLGTVMQAMGRPEAAIECFTRALAIRPGFADAEANLAGTRLALGEVDEAIAGYRRALAAAPDIAIAHSSLIFAMPYDPAVTGRALLDECRRWDERHGRPRQPIPVHANDPDPERRLRIGYVSPDFREHPVAYFMEPWLAAHDKGVVEVFCYSESAVEDKATTAIRAHADHWRSTTRMADAVVADMVRADGIDILMDCAGHTSGNRLTMFARRPAPVQVGTILGNACTTGLSSIDWIIGDPYSTPPGFEDQFAERLVRLPRIAAPFRPRASWPEPAPPREGPPVFACVADPSRVSPSVLPLWRRVLERVEGASLIFKHAAFNEPEGRERWSRVFAPLGEGMVLEGVPAGWANDMGFYGRVDVVLDSFPVVGVTSLLIPLWMGVPVVTQAGVHAAQRWAGAAALHHLGLDDLVATEPEGFVSTVVALAGDRRRLAELRASLRPAMAASAICDGPGFAREIETAFRAMWRTWSEGRQP